MLSAHGHITLVSVLPGSELEGDRVELCEYVSRPMISPPKPVVMSHLFA